MISYNSSKVSVKAFSLVEVVVAVGIFALAIVAVIGMLAPLGKSVGDVKDGDDASRLAGIMQSSLQEQVGRLRTANPATYWATFAGYLNGGTTLFASRDGTKVGLGTNLALWDTDSSGSVSPAEDAQKFFEVILQRNTTLSPAANDASAGFLAFTIELRWPGYSGQGLALVGDARAQQSQLLIPAAVLR